MTHFTKSLKAVAVLFLLGLVSTVSAATKITFSELSIVAGQTQTVEVNLENDATVGSFSFNVTLPQGLSVVDDSFEPVGRVTADSYAIFADAIEGGVRVTALDNTGEGIVAGNGTIFTFKVKAASEFTSGNITISNAEVTNTNGDEVTATTEDIVVTTGDAEYKVAVSEEEISIASGETKDIELSLTNTADLVGFEFVITLPEGFTLVDETVTATARLQGYTKRVKAENGSYKVVFSNLQNKVIGGNSGDPLLTFAVAAGEKFADGAVIKLTAIKSATPSGKRVTFDDLTVTVKDSKKAADEAAAKEAAQKAVTDLKARLEKAVPAEVAENEAVVAAKKTAADAVAALEVAVAAAESFNGNEAVAAAQKAAEEAVANLEKVAADAKKAYDEQVAAEQAAKEEAEAKAAVEKSIADLEARAAAIPDEVANNEKVAAAKAAADEAVAAAKKAVAEAEAVKDNEAVAAAVKAAEEAVKKLEDTVAAAVEAYEAEKAAEEALNAAVDKKVAEVEDYARAQKNQMTTNATDVAATFQAKVDEVVAKVKEQVAAAKEAGNLTEDVVDVTAAKNQIDAIYGEAVKAQKSYDKLSEQLDELAEAMEELDDIDFDEMSANDAADIKNQIAELEDALAAAREALNEDQENLAGKSLKDVLGMTATAFNKAINDVKNAVNVATGIKMATVINGAVEVYNVKGVRVDAPVKGLNMVKMADGTIKKLYIR